MRRLFCWLFGLHRCDRVVVEARYKYPEYGYECRCGAFVGTDPGR